MKPQTYKIFAQLCESIVQEATTLSSILPGDPAANKLISTLHRRFQLPHDQQYQPTDNISWSAINDTSRGAWVIIKFANGVGAIKALAEKSGYEVVGVTKDSLEVTNDKFTKGGDAINFFKELGLGKIQQLFVGKDTGERERKGELRARGQADLNKLKTTDVNSLTMRLKPLWVRAINAAMADIRGMAVTMIQNNALGKARNKIEKLSDLQSILDAIESGEIDNPGRNNKINYLKKLVNNSVVLTAAHYYPEETGEINRSYGGISGSLFGGDRKVLADIAAGDQKKLGTVLAFFKRQLISG